ALSSVNVRRVVDGEANMDRKKASQLFFAVTLIAIGVIGLTSGTFAPIWAPVPETLPAREPLAILSNLIAAGCGIALLTKRWASPGALVLLAYLIVWTLAFKAKFILFDPLEEVSYQSNGENLVLVAAAWVLFATSAARRTFPAGEAGLRTAYLLYGLALIAFGLSHFFYLEMTAPLVPAWLPTPVFWAYLTGGIYTATGIAIAIGLYARWAAIVVAVQIALITLLVWGPMLFSGPLSAMHWQETIVSWALSAGAFVLATGSPPATGWLRRPSPTHR
ncbi:MAG TPA: DoxX family membrane protein, partial [Sphingomicrobium sp.]